jgi:hypothetical protein
VNRLTPFAAGLAALLFAAPAAEAAPSMRDLLGRWEVSGTDSRGAYTGEVYLSVANGVRRVRASAALVYDNGAQRRWSDEGIYMQGRVRFEYDLDHVGGMAGVFSGTSNPERVSATFRFTDDDGFRFAATYQGARGFSGDETARRKVEDLVDHYLISLDDDRRRKLALEVGALDSDDGIDAILAAFEVEGLTVSIDADELRAQKTLSNAVPFQTAFLYAIESFVHDGDDAESPRALELDPLLSNLGAPYNPVIVAALQPRLTAKVRKQLRSGTIELMERGQNAEHGERVGANWIFTLDIPAGDHGHWAIVARDGSKAVYNYGFN